MQNGKFAILLHQPPSHVQPQINFWHSKTSQPFELLSQSGRSRFEACFLFETLPHSLSDLINPNGTGYLQGLLSFNSHIFNTMPFASLPLISPVPLFMSFVSFASCWNSLTLFLSFLRYSSSILRISLKEAPNTWLVSPRLSYKKIILEETDFLL